MKPPCTYTPDQWLNLCDYTPLEIGLVLVGTVFWNIAYGIIIRNGLRYQYVEMPYLAGASNFAWELVWGFVLLTDMGRLFVWGLRGWFFMDIFIFILLLRYGSKQIVNPAVRPYFAWIKISVFLFWIPVFYFFYQEGYDTSMGATSAYIITVVMSALYIQHIINRPAGSVFSGLSAWCQLISNTLMSVFVWLKYPDKHFLQLLTLAVFILNAVYVFIQHRQATELRHPVLPHQSAAVQAN